MNNTIKYKTISFKTTSVPRWGKIDALLDYFKTNNIVFLKKEKQLFEPLAEASAIDIDIAIKAMKAYYEIRASVGIPTITYNICRKLETVNVLLDSHAGEQLILASMLANTSISEDSDNRKIAFDKIDNDFGKEMTSVVKKLDKLARFNIFNKLSTEDFADSFITMSEDLMVVIIKLAQVNSELQYFDSTIADFSNITQEQIDLGRIAISSFAPIAHRLGLNRMKTEIEDLGFKISNYGKYTEIKDQIDNLGIDNDIYINATISSIGKQLLRNGIPMRSKDIRGAIVSGRPKSIYSIHKKITGRYLNKYNELGIASVKDLFAFRIIVPYSKTSKEDCFKAFALLQDLYPKQKDLCDYISFPKGNGYQSIHAIFQTDVNSVEIQIRDSRMHDEAEFGVCAHASYKGHATKGVDLSNYQEYIMKQGLDISNELGNDLAIGNTYVFMDDKVAHIVPEGQTIIDFASTLHSKAAVTLKGVTIIRNGKKIYPSIYSKLRKGDIIKLDFTEEQLRSVNRQRKQKVKKEMSSISEIKKQLKKIQNTLLSVTVDGVDRMKVRYNPKEVSPGDKVIAVQRKGQYSKELLTANQYDKLDEKDKQNSTESVEWKQGSYNLKRYKIKVQGNKKRFVKDLQNSELLIDNIDNKSRYGSSLYVTMFCPVGISGKDKIPLVSNQRIQVERVK